MSQTEAQEYADLVVEKLREWGILSATLTKTQRESLADAIRLRSWE